MSNRLNNLNKLVEIIHLDSAYAFDMIHFSGMFDKLNSIGL